MQNAPSLRSRNIRTIKPSVALICWRRDVRTTFDMLGFNQTSPSRRFSTQTNDFPIYLTANSPRLPNFEILYNDFAAILRLQLCILFAASLPIHTQCSSSLVSRRVDFLPFHIYRAFHFTWCIYEARGQRLSAAQWRATLIDGEVGCRDEPISFTLVESFRKCTTLWTKCKCRMSLRWVLPCLVEIV